MDLSQGVSNHKDELDSYENQFSQRLTFKF